VGWKQKLHLFQLGDRVNFDYLGRKVTGKITGIRTTKSPYSGFPLYQEYTVEFSDGRRMNMCCCKESDLMLADTIEYMKRKKQ